MTRDFIKNELKQIFVSVLRSNVDPASVQDTGVINQLGIDSIKSLEILIWVEDRFGIEIADEDLSAKLLDSLDALSEYVISKRSAGLVTDA